MPVSYVVDATRKMIRTRCEGQVTLAEVSDHFRTLESDPDCANRLSVLLDVSEITFLPESSQFWSVISELKKIQGTIQFDACAIVATRDAVFGMLRIFEVMAQPYFRVIRVFRTPAEAEVWLESQELPGE